MHALDFLALAVGREVAVDHVHVEPEVVVLDEDVRLPGRMGVGPVVLDAFEGAQAVHAGGPWMGTGSGLHVQVVEVGSTVGGGGGGADGVGSCVEVGRDGDVGPG